MTTNPRLTSRASVIRYWVATILPFVLIGAFIMAAITELTMQDNVMILLGIWFSLFLQRTFDGVAAARMEYKLYHLENEVEERERQAAEQLQLHADLLILSAADESEIESYGFYEEADDSIHD